MCASMHLYKWLERKLRNRSDSGFREQFGISGRWPLDLCPCGRVPASERAARIANPAEGHSSYALYGRKGDRRFSIYVPDDLAEDLERAIRNGRDLQKLMTEAGRRYTLALKNERILRNRK